MTDRPYPGCGTGEEHPADRFITCKYSSLTAGVGFNYCRELFWALLVHTVCLLVEERGPVNQSYS